MGGVLIISRSLLNFLSLSHCSPLSPFDFLYPAHSQCSPLTYLTQAIPPPLEKSSYKLSEGSDNFATSSLILWCGGARDTTNVFFLSLTTRILCSLSYVLLRELENKTTRKIVSPFPFLVNLQFFRWAFDHLRKSLLSVLTHLRSRKTISQIFVRNSQIIDFGPRSSKPLEFFDIFFTV